MGSCLFCYFFTGSVCKICLKKKRCPAVKNSIETPTFLLITTKSKATACQPCYLHHLRHGTKLQLFQTKQSALDLCQAHRKLHCVAMPLVELVCCELIWHHLSLVVAWKWTNVLGVWFVAFGYLERRASGLLVISQGGHVGTSVVTSGQRSQ